MRGSESLEENSRKEIIENHADETELCSPWQKCSTACSSQARFSLVYVTIVSNYAGFITPSRCLDSVMLFQICF